MLKQIDLSQTDLNLLVVFDTVRVEGNVGRAATRLHLTSSAVSHGLKRLRALFGDPLFLRTPRGVVPTARANELAEPIAEALARVRGIIESTAPFAPATSRRRFALGAPDATASVVLPALLSRLGRVAPGIDVTVRHVLPNHALDALDSRTVDVAIAQLLQTPPTRFARQPVYEDDFVIAARRGHPFLARPTLRRYCEARHALVSTTGQLSGHVDEALAAHGLTRRVVLSSPSFMLALAALTDSDLLAAVPRSLVTVHGARFAVACVEAPVAIPRSPLLAVTLQAALADTGVAWFVAEVVRAAKTTGARARPRRSARHA